MAAKDIRLELARLIQAGLGGRSLEQLWLICKSDFTNAGETLAWDTFTAWVVGDCFPANRKRQNLLGDAVGGSCGDVIKALKGLSFRGYRRRIMQEKETMSSGHGLHGAREFPWVLRDDGSGRQVKQMRITCAECGAPYHFKQRGSLLAEGYFRNKGWEVGSNATRDFCPACIAKRKVVKMADHTKRPPDDSKNGKEAPITAEADNKVMGPQDRRLLSRSIEDHWDDDEHVKAYRLGWNDVRVAKEYGVPLDWVQKVRTEDFGGSGEDPGIQEFLSRFTKLEQNVSDYDRHRSEYLTSSAAMEEALQKLTMNAAARDRQREVVVDDAAKIAIEMKRLAKIAEQIQHPFDKAG